MEAAVDGLIWKRKDKHKSLVDEWTAEFDELVRKTGHFVLRRYYAPESVGTMVPHWECKCGKTGWAYTTDHALKLFDHHLVYDVEKERMLEATW